MRIISLRQIWQRLTAHVDPPLMTIAMLLKNTLRGAELVVSGNV